MTARDPSTAFDLVNLLARLGVPGTGPEAGSLEVHSPIDGSRIAAVPPTSGPELDGMVERSARAFEAWRDVPPPVRGQLVRLFAGELRAEKEALARLITIENGKILEEARGEVQEAIDICEFAVGLSRQLYGLTIASERPGHRLMETWHPLGVVATLTAFNFPLAVWAWNFAIATVCGDSTVWKPSEKTPLTALAAAGLFSRAAKQHGQTPDGLLEVAVGGREAGLALADNPQVALVSATGSTAMGKTIAPRIAARLGRALLELGGNNGMVVAPSADLDLAVRAITFAAVGTAGQRCTTLRRLIVQEDIHSTLVSQLQEAYASLPIGNPLAKGTLVGPLIDRAAYESMEAALEEARAAGGTIFGVGRVLEGEYPDAYYVRPAVVTLPGPCDLVRRETFAPILYVLRYRSFDEAIRLHNDVPQGLASSIFTSDVREAERFMSAAGSDCGIVNVNVGPSGAEIGGAFGGEKDTGGGRESGSDAWKSYMRRATNTINYSTDLPLAQGIRFGGS